MKFNLISAMTRRAQTDLFACKTELERLLLIRKSGKPRANHCIDLDTLDTFYARKSANTGYTRARRRNRINSKPPRRLWQYPAK